MILFRAILISCAASAVMLVLSKPVEAHDIVGIFAEEKLPEDVRQKIDERRSLRASFSSLSSSVALDLSQLEAVIRWSATWSPAKPIRVCFFEGDQVLRERIANIASVWTQHGNVSFDFESAGSIPTCGGSSKIDIRISFRGRGHWSYVGTDSMLISADERTLNLEDFDVASPSEREFSRIVLHEFGHALGFEHEHQSPMATCDDEFDWPLIYKSIPWSKRKIDHNLRQLANSSAFLVSEYDKRSIMHYSLPARFFKRGRDSGCYIEANYVLSGRDEEGMRFAYPVVASRVLSEELPQIEMLFELPQLTDVQRDQLGALYEMLGRVEGQRRLSEE